MKKLYCLLQVFLFSSLGAFSAAHADCRDDIIASTPNSRFVVNANGTVLDLQTELMWMRCSVGQSNDENQCLGGPLELTWSDALSEAEKSGFAGFSDWYLPNIKELSSITEVACFKPSINTEIFPDTANYWYWSSSPDAELAEHAWAQYLEFGVVRAPLKSTLGHVRLVRVNK